MSTHSFEAETGRILELLTHSIYSNKEIFLRELISNAADAVDKARLKSLTDTSFLGDDTEFQIIIEADERKREVTITDNGIGMTQEELISHLGTIAKSGTKEFIEKLQKAKEDGDHNLIGQFGVGFYSSFMVADKVEVESRSALDTKAHKWRSDGKTGYDIKEIEKEKRGTTITLFLNEGNEELAKEWKIRELVKKYSNYVGVPIMMKETDTRSDEEKKKEPKELKFEQVNETKPIWKKSKSEIKDDELKSFYQSISMDFNEPLTHVHTNVEGLASYKSILFVPKEKNMFADMSDPTKEYGPKLYIQNVLILENAKELLPIWLRFVSGVVETSDLPLNISREILQSNTTLEKIRKGLTKKVIAELKKTLENNTEKYDTFLQNFGPILKEGIHYEPELKEEIAEAVKFKSMNIGKSITLDEYLEKAKGVKDGDTEKKTIYYITGKTESEVTASPYLSQFRENKVDVLFLTDPIDAWIVKALTEYKGASLKPITANDIELKKDTAEEKKKKEETKKEFKDFLEFAKNTISADKIEKVELNENLGNALSALKTPDGGLDPQMEKMMRAMGQHIPSQKRIFELNPKNELISSMKGEFGKDIKSQKLKDMLDYAYNSAILLEGGELEDMSRFIELTNSFAKGYIK